MNLFTIGKFLGLEGPPDKCESEENQTPWEKEMGDFDGDWQNPRIFIHAVMFSWEGSYYDVVKGLKLQIGEGKSARCTVDPSPVFIHVGESAMVVIYGKLDEMATSAI